MNAFAVSGLLISLTCIVVIAIVLRHGRQNVHRLCALLSLTVGIWGFGVLRIGIIPIQDAALALHWWKITHIGIIFIPVVFLHFVYEFLDKKIDGAVLSAYGLGFFFLFSLFTGRLIENVGWVFNSFYYDSQPPTALYTLFFIIWAIEVLYGHLLLFLNLKTAPETKRNQIKYFFLAFVTSFSGGITCYLPVFGIDIYPYGNLAVPLYPTIVTYAIIKHQLMDIHIVIRKSIVYTVLITFITTAYFLVIFLSEKFFQGLVGYNSNFISILAVIAIAILFTPLKERIQRFVDLRFFKGSLPKMAEENIFLRKELADKEKFKAVAVMASGMAHEIKNPLTAIKTFSEYISVKRNDQEFVDKFSKIVTKEVDRINSLVHRLLDFARPSALNLQEVNIHELLNDVLTFLSNELVRYRVRVETNFQNNGALMLTADQNQLKQVFLNLFNNAIEAMANGGTLTVETSVGNGFKPFPTDMTIIIADTGPGISQGDLKEIFNPFFTTKEHGTGLGLAVTKGIIEEHKGKINVESEVGKGTKFIITLPTVGEN